jgi:protoheme ferro-lyase
MIIGLVPVGGNSTRLNIPFSKSMLPQKGFDYYNPIINHCVQNLINTGVDKIIFGHGCTYKQDILAYYQNDLFCHLLEQKGPSDGGNRFINNIVQSFPAKDYIFCLPDTITTATHYKDLLIKDEVVCGVYSIPEEIKGDRLLPNGQFNVKTVKTQANSHLVWGTIKFTNTSLQNKITKEIGDWLNEQHLQTRPLGKMIDIGTWKGYNYYLNEF